MTRKLCVIAAVISLTIALFHIYIIFEGPWAYRYFGAGEKIYLLAQNGSLIPPLLTSAITMVFFIFSYYYFSAAGFFTKPPLFKLVLIAIAAIYTLRGVAIFPALLGGVQVSSFDFWSSALSLSIGIVHCFAAWSVLKN